jgi:hypothetical protein
MHRILADFKSLAWLQWIVAQIIGSHRGRDDILFGWHNTVQWRQGNREEEVESLGTEALKLIVSYRQALAEQERLRRRRRLISFLASKLFDWSWTWEEPQYREDPDSGEPDDEAFHTAAQATDYLLSQRHFEVPVVGARPILAVDSGRSLRLLVNHPYVPQQDLRRVLAWGLRQLRHDRSQPLTPAANPVVECSERTEGGLHFVERCAAALMNWKWRLGGARQKPTGSSR